MRLQMGAMKLLGGIMIGIGTALSSVAEEPALNAKWIWHPQDAYQKYNDTIVAEKTATLPKLASAHVRITADSFYRLVINGHWVNDGPCRSWPNHFQYDVIDVAPYLVAGENTIQVTAKYFGVGTFHQIPKQAGLFVQLDGTDAKGAAVQLVSDESWSTRVAAAWVSNTPKKSIQMGPFEVYDARRESAGGDKPAKALFAATAGPWQGLNPRDCPLLTRVSFPLAGFLHANAVDKAWRCYVFPTAQLLYPGMIEANGKVSMASAVATIIDAPKAMTLHLESPDGTVTINGQRAKDGAFELKPGENFLFSAVTGFFGHWNKDTEIRFIETEGYTLKNPVDGNAVDPWCFAAIEDAKYVSTDYEFGLLPQAEKDAIQGKIRGILDGYLKSVDSAAAFTKAFGGAAKTLLSASQLTDDVHWQFRERKVVADASGNVTEPNALFTADGKATVISPNAGGDIELAYDLGTQNVGYYDFVIDAEEGLVVDVAQVEYIAKDGRVQHTGDYRNAMRYICKAGENRFTSLERRSGRFVFITLRNQTKPVSIDLFQIIESTYPVKPLGDFACSDPDLDAIWAISAHTLKLCMEDTFTDCPLYEQTHWVGDARNEAVFGFTAFGAEDLAKRCVRLTAYSLESYPIAGCQTPSTWDILLPAWSFLWGISVWDYYEYTGDEAFVKEMWPYVVKNLEGAQKLRDERGLFSGPFWNMFDWSGIDDNHNTVTHNSMFVVGAIDAALKCADVVGDAKAKAWLTEYRASTVDAINALWVAERQAYPDSVHADGTLSPKSSVHTSFLALLYGIADESKREALLKYVLNPPADMVKLGSPFAAMYEYEALEKMGQQDAIVEHIRENYIPMVRDGATSVWESFPTGTTGSGGFPTRSHTHAWSSAPVHFLNRIVLGIVPVGIGGSEVVVSPHLSGLTWAKGSTVTVKGPVSVEWRLDGDTVNVMVDAPSGVKVRFESNESLAGKQVKVTEKK